MSSKRIQFKVIYSYFPSLASGGTQSPRSSRLQTPCDHSADLLLLCSVTRELQDQQASVYWLKTAADVVYDHPFPRFQQNYAVFGHLFQQCFEQRATDAAINVCATLEKYIVRAKGEDSPDLR